ncbi:hypothetical protein PE067_09310 [Paracoccus sp. DMF-8]|uniref:hypothetical protein n=1 Tax=Paracoccus sp. DMF-8 TaxID=3019445 RepID=UPI0023E85263|nr:hypothetical protein [Paracoccus sp. DMF-8]MDF3606316.1 hypothetical protein [Paracoccus sp. DMF-8]
MTQASGQWPDQALVSDCDHPQRMGVYEPINRQRQDAVAAIVQERRSRRRAQLIKLAHAVMVAVAVAVAVVTGV